MPPSIAILRMPATKKSYRKHFITWLCVNAHLKASSSLEPTKRIPFVCHSRTQTEKNEKKKKEKTYGLTAVKWVRNRKLRKLINFWAAHTVRAVALSAFVKCGDVNLCALWCDVYSAITNDQKSERQECRQLNWIVSINWSIALSHCCVFACMCVCVCVSCMDDAVAPDAGEQSEMSAINYYCRICVRWSRLCWAMASPPSLTCICVKYSMNLEATRPRSATKKRTWMLASNATLVSGILPNQWDEFSLEQPNNCSIHMHSSKKMCDGIPSTHLPNIWHITRHKSHGRVQQVVHTRASATSVANTMQSMQWPRNGTTLWYECAWAWVCASLCVFPPFLCFSIYLFIECNF